MFGFVPPPTWVKQPPAPKAPKACIRLVAFAAYCQRPIETNEFAFVDAERAAHFYDRRTNDKTPIAACEDCVDEIHKQVR